MAKATKARAKSPPAKKADDEFDGYDVLIVNGIIEDKLFADVLKCVVENKKSDKVIVALVTYGGQANAAYRISRLLQGLYEDLIVFVPSFCKSAGTLIALSANKLIISPFGEIGPLDVQLLERDELGERKSGLTIRSALEDLKAHSYDLFQHFMLETKKRSQNLVSFKLAAEVASGITSGIMTNIYGQIHPDVLGKDFRDLSVATKYGERLNRKFCNVKKGGIERLVHDYPSHDFVIDYEEAGEIFERVDMPSGRMRELMQRRRNQLMVPKVKNFVIEMETWAPPAVAKPSGANDEDGSGAEDSGVAEAKAGE